MFVKLIVLYICIVGIYAFTCPGNSLPSLTNKPKCFLFVKENQYFLKADEVCAKNGGKLVSIHNMLDNMFITRKFFNLHLF